VTLSAYESTKRQTNHQKPNQAPGAKGQSSTKGKGKHQTPKQAPSPNLSKHQVPKLKITMKALGSTLKSTEYRFKNSAKENPTSPFCYNPTNGSRNDQLPDVWCINFN
jgi:hypothetical protein